MRIQDYNLVPILFNISVLLDVQANLPETSRNGFGDHLYFKCLGCITQPISIMKIAIKIAMTYS